MHHPIVCLIWICQACSNFGITELVIVEQYKHLHVQGSGVCRCSAVFPRIGRQLHAITQPMPYQGAGMSGQKYSTSRVKPL